MKHEHLYLLAGEAEKPNGTHGFRTIVGKIYVCVPDECDRVIHVWADGTKDVVKEGIPEVK